MKYKITHSYISNKKLSSQNIYVVYIIKSVDCDETEDVVLFDDVF